MSNYETTFSRVSASSSPEPETPLWALLLTAPI